MNRKQLIFVLVALAVIGSAGWILYNQHRQSWNQLGAKMGDKVLPNFHPNDVASIRIKGDTEVNLVHKNDLWRVAERSDYPANFGRISDALLKLAGLKVVEANAVGPSQYGRVNLEEPGTGPTAGILVEFKDGQGKVIETLLLGKKHFKDQGEVSHAVVSSDADGRYIRLREDTNTVFLISDALGSLEPRPEPWLNREFFKVENARSITHTEANAADSWKISRENASDSAAWVLADAKAGEALDTRRPPMMLNSLSTASFSDVLPQTDLAALGLDQPIVVTVETFDHFTYNLKIGAKAPDESCHMIVNVTADIPTARVPGKDEKPEDAKKLDAEFQERTKKLQAKLKQEQALGSWVYKVNGWILDSIARSRPQILEGYKDVAADAQNTAAAPAKPKQSWTPRVIQ